MPPEGYEVIFARRGGAPSLPLLNYYLIPASSHIVMVHVHTLKPNEPSLGEGEHVRLGLALTPTYVQR